MCVCLFTFITSVSLTTFSSNFRVKRWSMVCLRIWDGSSKERQSQSTSIYPLTKIESQTLVRECAFVCVLAANAGRGAQVLGFYFKTLFQTFGTVARRTSSTVFPGGLAPWTELPTTQAVAPAIWPRLKNTDNIAEWRRAPPIASSKSHRL